MEEKELLQELYTATSNSRRNFESDVQTLTNNLSIIDRTSPIADKYCITISNYLGSSKCSGVFDNALWNLSNRINGGD